MPEAPLEIVQARLETIRDTIKRLDLRNRGRTLGAITISGGISILPEHGGTAEELLRAADQALYRAKSGGRDRVIVAG